MSRNSPVVKGKTAKRTINWKMIICVGVNILSIIALGVFIFLYISSGKYLDLLPTRPR